MRLEQLIRRISEDAETRFDEVLDPLVESGDLAKVRQLATALARRLQEAPRDSRSEARWLQSDS